MRLTSLLALLLLPLLTPAADLDYKVGAAKVDITPDHPIRLNGFGSRRDESSGVYQKLYARALAIDDGTKSPAVLVTVDVLGMPADLYDALAKRLAKAGVKAERLAVAATHTHTGPMLSGANPTIFGVPIPKEHLANIDKYTPVFLDRVEEAATAALKALQPARLEWGVGQAKFAANRRNGGGPTDHDLPVLFAKDAKGKVIAVYLTYACHCVTLSHNKLGGDWAGFAAAAVEEQFDGAVGLVGIGCGADQNPTSGVTGDKEANAAAQGKEIAAEVKRLAGQYLFAVNGKLTATTAALDLPFAPLPDRKGWEEKAKRQDAIGHHARVTLAKLDAGEKLPTSLSYPVQTWAFGDTLAMVHLPGEVVVDYGLRLKRELDGGRVWVTAYANNAPCYIPSERVLKEGGYEGGGAMIYYDLPAAFAPGLEDKIVSEVTKQLGKPFAARFDGTKTAGTRPLSPQRSLAAIKTRPGVTADLVLAEPLVQDPVAIAFGPDGALWVAEMADYPTGTTPGKFDPGGRVVRLTSSRAVFLDNIPFPTGVLPWRKGVLVCAAPDILYAEDTDGDGKADKVEKLYSGFGSHNFQGRVNGLAYGLDGWVYGSCGLFGGTITCGKTGKKVPLGDRDFRIKPDTGELEPAAGRTQQGRVRSDRGDWFGCDNSDLLRHYPLPDHALGRNPHAAYPTNSRSIAAGPVFPAKADAQRFLRSGPAGGVTAACGVGIYRDDLLGAEFSGDAFTCESVNLLVTRRELTPSGGTFTAGRAKDEASSEFLASSDGWFRPVQATTGPDGGLWVVDMYRFLIEHPIWVPESDLAKIDVRAGAGLGRLYRLRPTDKPVRKWGPLTTLSTAELVAAMDSPNGWHRDAAMMQLVWANDPKAAEPLLALAKNGKHPAGRMQALCTLGLLGGKPDDVSGFLTDADAGVRQHAVRLLAPHLDGKLGAKVAALVNDADPGVRMEVAVALGGWKDADVGVALAKLAHRDRGDPIILAAVSSSWTAANLPAFAAALLKESGDAGPPPDLTRNLLATAASMDGGSALPGLLAAVAPAKAERFERWQLAATAGTLDALARKGQGWAKLPAEVKAAVEPVVRFARMQVASDKTAEGDVLTALPLLARDPDTLPADVKRVASLLAPTRPAAVQTEAVAALARTSDNSAATSLVVAWGSASPAVRARVLDALLDRKGWHGELLTAVEKGTIPAAQVDAARRGRLTASTDADVKKRAEKAFAGGPSADRKKVLDEYTKAVDPKAGVAERGKAVFARVCANCHKLDGVGHAVGPDLSAAANKSAAYLLGEILDPNRTLDSRYAEYTVNTTDGRTAVGLLASETAAAVTLRGPQGKEETIPRAAIDTYRGGSKSLMPEGLEKDIPAPGMADLLAYLLSSSPAPKKLPGNTPAEVKASDGRLTLPASSARVYGGMITFEDQFGNLGYWNDTDDHAVWLVNLDAAAEFDVYLDYSCANDSAGNKFSVGGGEPELTGKVAATGGGWDKYALLKAGTLKLPGGGGKVVVRPAAPLKGALFDLRTVYLVPKGEQPKTTAAKSPAEQITALVAGLKPDDIVAEYKLVPKVWEIAIAAGKADDTATVKEVLAVALPAADAPLRHWQAVVVGGGIVNGLSQSGRWPLERVSEIIGNDDGLRKRWRECLKQSYGMAADSKVPDGTRYDALRLVGLGDWATAEPLLRKHLAKDANAELQQGAVSGLSDADHADAAGLLVKALPDLTEGNRNLAVAGLMRTPGRVTAFLDAVEAGTAKAAWVNQAHRAELAKLTDEAVKARAAKVLK